MAVGGRKRGAAEVADSEPAKRPKPLAAAPSGATGTDGSSASREVGAGGATADETAAADEAIKKQQEEADKEKSATEAGAQRKKLRSSLPIEWWGRAASS